MFVKEIIIDGFKSYGNRVTIGPFDQQFNAITGLNGTGKSNILDAICFVLGSTDMKQARVNTLRDLIYKNGQAGVVKGSVSIVFDTADPNSRMVGYEEHTEVTVTREVNMQSRTKFYINGFTSQQQTVEDIFHSVHLNIKNPHFLIMQGRITKVLNMKPNEILAMVEEATGASRYEMKKKTSFAQIEKKQTVLNSIDDLLKENIVPNLQKLQHERSGLEEFNCLVLELEHLTKVYTGYQYVKFQEMCDASGSKMEQKRQDIQNVENQIENLHSQAQQYEEDVKRLEKQKDAEFGGLLTRLDEELKNAQMNEARLTTKLSTDKDVLNEAIKKKKASDKGISADTKTLKNKENEFNAIRESFETLESNEKETEAKMKQAEKNFEAVSSGASLAADGDAAGTLNEQLRDAQDTVAQCSTELQTVNMRLKHCHKEVRVKESAANKQSADFDRANQQVASVRKECQNLRRQLDSLNFDSEQFQQLNEERKLLSRECAGLDDEIRNLESRNYSTRLEHNARVDQRKVYGMVCNLFTVKDPKYAVALEECLGGRLYHVVVEDQQTAKTILDSNTLKRQTTFLPLDRIRDHQLDTNALRAAEKKVGRDNVKAAIDLVEYEPHLATIMRYVFGDNLICPDMDIGKQVAYDPKVYKRVITLEGEVFTPQGTLTGGGRRSGPSLLQSLIEVNKRRAELNQKREELQQLENTVRSLDQENRRFQEAKRKYDQKQHELELIEKNLENTSHYQMKKEVEQLKEEIAELESKVGDLPKRKADAEKRIKEIQNKMKNSKALREKELKEAEDALKAAQKNYEKSRKQKQEKSEKVNSLKMEIDSLKTSIAEAQEQAQALDQEVEQLQAIVDESDQAVTDAKQATYDKLAEVKHQKQMYEAKSADIGKLIKKREKCLKDVEVKNLEIKKLNHDIEQFEKESKDAEEQVKHLLKKNPWINEEKHLFGNENAGYAYNRKDFNIKAIKAQIEDKQNKKAAMSKTVNMRANTMIEDREKDANKLQDRRRIVESDKRKILEYIKEVDRKKKEELERAYETINQNFGSIFTSMLPGTQAKLVPPPGKTIHEGLEVKVAFGNLWKESLTELSGGQRSLVALSLILALLRYNPAPIYILDEVDAALDQSHTTNIGRMIKENFPNSQFIIVSLKDDMFNNANVLFRTRLVDGSSSVVRQARR